MRQISPADYAQITLGHYQDCAVARQYAEEYEGPWRLRTLAARLVAVRERSILGRVLSRLVQWDALPMQKVLDLPCGTGKLAAVFSRLPVRVMAADISRQMMEIADGAYRTLPGFQGFTQADASATAFADGEFDTVVCLRLLHRVPAAIRQSILGELSRVSQRYVVLSAGVDSPVQRIRRHCRQWATGTVTVPYPTTRRALAGQLAAADLTPVAWIPVLPLLSSEWVVVCEKSSGAGRC